MCEALKVICVSIRYMLVTHTNTGSNNAIYYYHHYDSHLQKEEHGVWEVKCPQYKSSSSKLQSMSTSLASRWHSIPINYLARSPSLPMLAFKALGAPEPSIFPAFPPSLLSHVTHPAQRPQRPNTLLVSITFTPEALPV